MFFFATTIVKILNLTKRELRLITKGKKLKAFFFKKKKKKKVRKCTYQKVYLFSKTYKAQIYTQICT